MTLIIFILSLSLLLIVNVIPIVIIILSLILIANVNPSNFKVNGNAIVQLNHFHLEFDSKSITMS